MDYRLDNDPYLLGDTGVFRNKLGITDHEKLRQAEARITTIELAILEANPLALDFDLANMQEIHLQVFGLLYDWAGQLRTVEMSKGQTEFAKVDAMHDYAVEVFGKLHSEHLLVGLEQDEFVRRLAHYYSELNLLHPFREGNGRVLRAFVHNLAHYAGWKIDWSTIDGRENVQACIAAYHGDEQPLAEMLAPMVSKASV